MMLEQRIVENANRYKELAQTLDSMHIDAGIDADMPEEIKAALIRLYYAKAFEAEIEKCADLLGEDTPEETVNAVAEAEEAIEAASEAAFNEAQMYADENEEFAARAEGITASTQAEGLAVRLIKLFKCEELIRAAYRCSVNFPLYGLKSSFFSAAYEDEAVTDAHSEIAQKLGIDIYELLSIRQSLVEEIGTIIKGAVKQT